MAATLLALQTAAQALPLPEEFTISERWMAWCPTFDIAIREQTVASLQRRFGGRTTQYLLCDGADTALALAQMRYSPFGAFFDIRDAAGHSLGTVEEKVFTFFPSFSLMTADGALLLKATMNLWGTSYTMKADDGRLVAVLSRPLWRLRQKWTVRIVDTAFLEERTADPLLLYMVAALQTDLNTWKRQAAALHAANDTMTLITRRSPATATMAGWQAHSERLRRLGQCLANHTALAHHPQGDEGAAPPAAALAARLLRRLEGDGDVADIDRLLSDETVERALRCALYRLLAGCLDPGHSNNQAGDSGS